MKKIVVAAAILFVAVLAALSHLAAAPGELHHAVIAAAAIPMAVKPELFTIAQVCRILAVGKTTIYKMIARRELTAVKIGNKTRSARGTRITAKSVEALLASAPKIEITGKSYLTLKTRRRLAREQVAAHE
jgi:excisionase family DNA binding protein